MAEISCRRASIILCWAMLMAAPAIVPAADEGLPTFDETFLTLDRLPFVESPETRIAAYKSALSKMAIGGESWALPSLVDAVLDLSALVAPEHALAAAMELSGRSSATRFPPPEPMAAKDYERLGVGLLRAARLARFGGELEHAAGHLKTARHVFWLASHEALIGDAEPDDDAGSGLVHRAMVRLEQIVLSESRNAWLEVTDLLARLLEREPTGARAEWATRMLHHPETYVVDEGAFHMQHYRVGGDIRKPMRIFTPQPCFPPSARKARIQGTVIVLTLIDRHGHVAALKVVKGLPLGLSEEALRTMATWLFEPATLYGEPIVVSYFLTMSFWR